MLPQRQEDTYERQDLQIEPNSIEIDSSCRVSCVKESAGSHTAAVPVWRSVCHTHAGQEVTLPAVCNTKILLLFTSINCFNI